MIVLIACASIIGVFIAGFYFAAHTVGALVLLGAAAVMLGVLFAAAETRGFEGYRTEQSAGTWGDISKTLFRMNEARARFFNDDKVYVQTPNGPVPVRSVFQARINHDLAIVLDPDGPEDHVATFNALKQGVL